MTTASDPLGADLILTDKLMAAATPDVMLILMRQVTDSLVRKLTQRLAPGITPVHMSHDLLEQCSRPKEKCSVSEPHKHFIIEFNLMSDEELAELRQANDDRN